MMLDYLADGGLVVLAFLSGFLIGSCVMLIGFIRSKDFREKQFTECMKMNFENGRLVAKRRMAEKVKQFLDDQVQRQHDEGQL